MSKEEKLPHLRFPEFNNMGNWKEKSLGELGKLINGLTYSPNDVRESGLLVLRSSNIQDGKIDLDDSVYVSPSVKGANITEPNDILVCVRNGSKNLIGKNAIIPAGLPLATHGAFMTVFRSKSAKFVFQLFQTDAYQRQVDCDLGATINSINGNNFIKYTFYVPGESEQQKIADCLSSLDDVITAQNQKLDLLKAHKKGLMQDLFPGEGESVPNWRFKEFERNGNWIRKNLGEIGEFVGGGTPDTGVAEYWEGSIPWFTPTEIKERYLRHSKRKITEKGLRNSSAKILPAGSLLITTRATVGDLAIVEVPSTTNQGFQSLICNEGNVNIFWYYWFSQHKYELLNRSSGSTFFEVSKNAIAKIETLCPEKIEQKKIGDALSSIDDLIDTQLKKIDLLKSLKKGLMQQLFPTF